MKLKIEITTISGHVAEYIGDQVDECETYLTLKTTNGNITRSHKFVKKFITNYIILGE